MKNMKSIFVCFICLFSLFSFEVKAQTLLDTLKSKSVNNQISEKWDYKLFEQDKGNYNNGASNPNHQLAFPVEKYEYYCMSNTIDFKIDNHLFSGMSFAENVGGKSGKFEPKYGINLIFYTGSENVKMNYNISSRNNPYLTIGGSIKLKNQYDFVGVKSPDELGFLVVSLKSFDLRFGQTIIIFPSDNSFYYLQLEENPKSNQEFVEYVNRIKSNPKIGEMLKLVKK
jgi:hypothetical protein